MSKEQLIEMISECRKAINNASSFGDTATVESIQRQINVYENKLNELEAEESPKSVKEECIEWLKQHIEQAEVLINEVNSTEGTLMEYEFIPMSELDDYLQDMSPYDILCKAQFGHFNIMDDYFSFDRLENLTSFIEYEAEDYLRNNMEEIFDMAMDVKDFISWPIPLAEILVKGGYLDE